MLYDTVNEEESHCGESSEHLSARYYLCSPPPLQHTMLAAQHAVGAPLRARAARRTLRSPLVCSATALTTMEVTGRKVEVYADAAAASAAVCDSFVAAYNQVGLPPSLPVLRLTPGCSACRRRAA